MDTVTDVDVRFEIGNAAKMDEATVIKITKILQTAQAVLTCLNVGDVAKESAIHLELRRVMVENRDEVLKALEATYGK